jgi:2-oxoglutarate dehydrogenase E2 component (dihydrolipoamide succinyltransferase)
VTEATGKEAPAPPAEPVKPAEPEPPPLEAAETGPAPEPLPAPQEATRSDLSEISLAPSVRRLVTEKNLDPTLIPGTGPDGRITKGDVVLYLESAPPSDSVARPDAPAVPAAAPADLEPAKPVSAAETVSRKPMSPIRQRIAARLLEAKHSTAMLTTFNEIDMFSLMAIRTRYKEAFKQKYGVNLGMMSFFINACVEALKEIPQINAFIDGKDFIEHHYYHIGVAVGSERGLVVPVIRHADQLSFAGLEQAIVDYVKKIQENRLELADLEGGTFTISNGGVYGSLLSTPILNTPQSAILGMHKI